MDQNTLNTPKSTSGEEQLTLLKQRRSPVAFSEQEVSTEQLEQLFEATRWAASCFNEQPWRFIVATKEQEDHFSKVLNGLNPHNQKWAQHAPVLMLTFAKKTFEANGKPNMHSWHDLGLAVGNMSAQATAMGLHLHQMAGIVRDHILNDFDIPEDYDIVSGIALGYKMEIEEVPEELTARETKERTRKPLNEIVFEEAWGKSGFR